MKGKSVEIRDFFFNCKNCLRKKKKKCSCSIPMQEYTSRPLSPAVEMPASLLWLNYFKGCFSDFGSSGSYSCSRNVIKIIVMLSRACCTQIALRSVHSTRQGSTKRLGWVFLLMRAAWCKVTSMGKTPGLKSSKNLHVSVLFLLAIDTR